MSPSGKSWQQISRNEIKLMTNQICTEVTTIGDLLVRATASHPDRAAIVFPDERASYAELYASVQQVARGLLALGVQPGQNIGLFLPNGLEFLHAFFGISLIGCVVVPLNTRHKATELGYIIKDADLVAIITSGRDTEYVDLPAILDDALPSLRHHATPFAAPLAIAEAPRLRHVIDLGGPARPGMMDQASFLPWTDRASVQQVEDARRQTRIRDTALIMYTSGTTANPKGCMLSHEAVTRGPVERARYRLKSPDKDVTWAAGPLFHIGSLAPFIGSLGVAGTFLADRFFDPERAIRLLEENEVTLAWPWFSAIVQGIIDHPRFDPARLSKLRYFFLIAPETLVRRVQALLPNTEILQACGMTETGGVFALSLPDDDADTRAITQGKAAPGVGIRIVDAETGLDCADGKMGEIWVRGFCVMDGYYNHPELTVDTIDADGWLHTGDLYSRSATGDLLFQGRLKDMLKVGGENVATMELEAFLCSHPDVKLAEVVGKADPRLDEVPVAFVELREGATLLSDELIGFCRGKIASYKIPREVYFMQAHEWPMSATKVNKRALRTMLSEG